MLAALRAYDDVRDAGAIRSWLFAIAARKAVDAHRRARASPSRSPISTRRRPGTSPCGTTRSGAACAALPDKQREAVALRYVADLSHREIAEVMGTSEAAARRNVFEGLERLRRQPRPLISRTRDCARLPSMSTHNDNSELEQSLAERGGTRSRRLGSHPPRPLGGGRALGADRRRLRAARDAARYGRRRRDARGARPRSASPRRTRARSCRSSPTASRRASCMPRAARSRRPGASSTSTSAAAARRSRSHSTGASRRGFRREVLRATAAIPYGHTASYRDVATSAGSPARRARRARRSPRTRCRSSSRATACCHGRRPRRLPRRPGGEGRAAQPRRRCVAVQRRREHPPADGCVPRPRRLPRPRCGAPRGRSAPSRRGREVRDSARAHRHRRRQGIGLGRVARDHDGARRLGRRARGRVDQVVRGRAVVVRPDQRAPRGARERIAVAQHDGARRRRPRRCSRPRGDRRARRPCRRRPRAGSPGSSESVRTIAAARSALHMRATPPRSSAVPSGTQARRRTASTTTSALGMGCGRGVTEVRGGRLRWLSR